MTVEVLNDPTHQCELPDPAEYPPGTDIRCTTTILREGALAECGKRYTRTHPSRRKAPRWAPYEWSW